MWCVKRLMSSRSSGLVIKAFHYYWRFRLCYYSPSQTMSQLVTLQLWVACKCSVKEGHVRGSWNEEGDEKEKLPPFLKCSPFWLSLYTHKSIMIYCIFISLWGTLSVNIVIFWILPLTYLVPTYTHLKHEYKWGMAIQLWIL